jgi:4-amino-4-deoxy-L-arabinose transferase-like glycosyltransferase
MPAGGAHGPEAARSAPGEAARLVLLLIVATALLRVALGGLLGLSVDESYTVAISRHAAWSHFDHPPLHVWLVGAWAWLLRSEQPLLLRLPDIAMFAASTWLMYRLTAAVYGGRAGVWAAVSLNLAPLFTLNAAGGIVPDGPLVLCSLLAVRCFVRAVLEVERPSRALAWMLGTGGAAGFALLSKYTAVFVPLALGLYLLSCRPRLLGTPAPWLAALLAVALFAPVLLWNRAHGWASFVFQGSRALPEGVRFGSAALDLAGELLYLLPWIGVALLSVLVRALRRGPRDQVAWLFAVLSILPIAAFALIALWAQVLPHWAAIGWLFAFPLLGAYLADTEPRHPRVLHWTTTATAAVLLGAGSLFATQAASGWLDRFVPSLAAHDPTVDFLDWRELDGLVGALAPHRRGMVVATVSWIDAGKADYALGGRIPVLCLSDDPRGFAFLQDPRRFRGRDALIVAAASRADWLSRAAPHFRRIVPGRNLVLKRAGEPALTLHTAWGYGLEEPRRAPPPPPPAPPSR